MIPTKQIIQWRQYAPWVFESQIEQDLVLSRALVAMFQQPIVRDFLAFRGGTALNKLYCNSSARYSEDIDLVQIKDAPIGELMSAIREAIDPWLGQAKWKQTSRSVKLVYRFQSEGSPSIPLRLKIEINTVEPFTIYGFQYKNYAVNSSWFSGETTIRTYVLDELMGTKLRALYQRSKGRDLYDLWMSITDLGANCSNILKAFYFYNERHGVRISRAEYEKNLLLKQESKDFILDAKQVLPNTINWNPDDGFKLIFKDVIPLMPGDSWKGSDEKKVKNLNL